MLRKPLLPGRDSLSPALSSDGRWYRITSVSWTCPLPATAKNKSVLVQDCVIIYLSISLLSNLGNLIIGEAIKKNGSN